ncbi:leucine-rich repeat LGI family member 2 isoform X2 [Esox lucius]|uniref:LRRCT domain-containing protein n=1 Tax=Esox lucius TaxID=8010 RepID=A0A6Q2XWU4_ESOLU|nr:leucine-rich repeat LGI family member 2 isoform X2 [Esox lucius]
MSGFSAAFRGAGWKRCNLHRVYFSLTHATPTRNMLSIVKTCVLFSVLCLYLAKPIYLKRVSRCPSTCSCSKESIICVGSSSVPRIIPNDINSLSIVNGTFSEVKETMFAHMPSLQLLLLNSNSLITIRDDAFSGLPHLEYLFIESNKIETVSKYAFRGLRDLTHLDLRGNAFECDCRAKWLMLWLKNTNATVSDVICAGPKDMTDKQLNNMASLHNECTSTDLILHQSVPSESLSVDTFSYKNDVYVAIAAPNTESCMVLQWDHIEMNFRTYDNITGQSIVGCKSVVIQNQVFVIVAQLFGGSHIYKFDEDQSRFSKFQDIEVSKISKPNDIEAFQIAGEWFFVIADSSKAGLSTLYKWNNKGFYSYQSLHEWFRDTDAEFVDLDGKSHLILASRSQVPVIYQWSRNTQKFALHGEIPNMEDVVAIKAFQINEDLYLAMTRYIGDSKVVRWSTKQFIEIQALPSRGSMILQPFSFKERHYLALGSDYTFSHIYLWDANNKLFERFKEVYIMAPRSFTVVSTDRRDFIFSSSFKGSTQIFEHIMIDLSV